MKNKIPYVKLQIDDTGNKIQVIPLNYARVGALFYFFIGIIIGIFIRSLN